MGRLIAISDPDSSYSLDYDKLGRVTVVDNSGTPGVPNVVLTYAYDAAGNVTSVDETIDGQPGASTVYTRDALDRINAITQSGAGVTPKQVRLGYDVASELQSVLRFIAAGTTPGVTTTYTFDDAGRLKSLTHSNPTGTIADYQFTLDAAGRITQIAASDDTSVYTYDDLNQLVGVTHTTQPDESFAFDAAGNPTGAGFSVDTGNRVASDGDFDYVYDAEGNRIRRTEIATGNVTEYVWDHRNRLTLVTEKDAGGNIIGTVSITYDAFGQWIARVTDSDGAGPLTSQTERYVHDRGQVALVFDGAGQLLSRYLYGPKTDWVLAEESAGSVRWMLGDQLLTVRDVVDASGVLLNHLRYDTFGKILSQTDDLFAPRFSFTGREYIPQIGLYYYRARFYDPALRRFLSEDPIRFSAGDVNLSRYVGNDPVSLVDPMGLCGFGLRDLIKSGTGASSVDEWLNSPMRGPAAAAITEIAKARDRFVAFAQDEITKRFGNSLVGEALHAAVSILKPGFIADAFDRSVDATKAILEKWVNSSESGSWQQRAKQVVSGALRAAMFLGSAVLDTLRFGEGFASGTRGGFIADAMRAPVVGSILKGAFKVGARRGSSGGRSQSYCCSQECRPRWREERYRGRYQWRGRTRCRSKSWSGRSYRVFCHP
jgi:RHS repeat-associated protein